MNKKVVLIILDGWGIAADTRVSAIDAAHTPFMDSLYPRYPNSRLEASGLAVGLPEGQMGNSEVGHMNIGAGRVVYQDLVRISKAIEEHALDDHPVLNEAFRYVIGQNRALHFIGLVSDGGVHSHIHHLMGLISLAHRKGVTNIFVHAFTDGRDTDPRSGAVFLQKLNQHMAQTSGRIASVVGRYYAMDRDKRWERTRLAYDLLVHGKGTPFTDAITALEQSYAEGITDEFVKPAVIVDKDQPIGIIRPHDAVICFNFRTDRGRQITRALTQQDFPEHDMYALPLHYITLTRYDDTFRDVRIVFDKDNLNNTLGEVLSRAGKKQIRIAETEKYPHVTFFFSGGREEPFPGETRILCPSPRVPTYDLKPEMSAYDIKDRIVVELKKQEADFVCLNFANPDMVGHTGVFKAAVKACEAVDFCAGQVTEVALNNGYTVLIMADHGNADCMINPDGSPHTAHTTNPVPCILVDKELRPRLLTGKLGDIAPTILTLMGIPVPAEMTGNVLLSF
jgi:2,3-bisphosphoglycerate-independent phosphoglycerate mutase